jgi:hypothetical protein
MKYKITLVILVLAIFLFLMVACEGPDQPTYTSANDPNPTGLNPATINSISPDSGYFVDRVTITGTGFNTDPAYTFVAVGNLLGKILSISPTELTIKLPYYSDETVDLKIAIKGSEFWSNSVPFTFYDASPLLKVIDEEIVWPNGVAVDNDDNVYIGSADEGIIYQIDPSGNKTEFAEVPISGSMEFGPENYLYICTQGDGKIVRVSPDGTTVEDVVEVESPIDFDWDADGNMYIVSNWIEAEEMGGIFRYDTAGNLTLLVTLGSCKCLRIFENILVVSDIWEGNILRYDITASGLENEEVIYAGDSPLGIEFDVEGTLYFTEAWEVSLYSMKPEAGASVDVLYKDQLETPMHYLTFYKKNMYIVYPGWADVGKTFSVYLAIDQAPNHGRP